MALSWLFFVPVRSLRIFSFYSQVIMVWQFFFFHLSCNGDFKLISVRFIISSTTWSLLPKRFYKKPVTKTATWPLLFVQQANWLLCLYYTQQYSRLWHHLQLVSEKFIETLHNDAKQGSVKEALYFSFMSSETNESFSTHDHSVSMNKLMKELLNVCFIV